MNQEVLNDISKYNQAMMSNMTDYALSIEKKYGLAGFPPQIVSGILNIHSEGGTIEQAQDLYFGDVLK